MPDKDEIEGRLKQAGGALTGDEEMKREGEGQEAWGEAKDKANEAKEKAGDKLDEWK